MRVVKPWSNFGDATTGLIVVLLTRDCKFQRSALSGISLKSVLPQPISQDILMLKLMILLLPLFARASP